MKKSRRNLRREKQRELFKIQEDENFYWNVFYSFLFSDTLLHSYRDLFNWIKDEFVKYATWANKYKYKHYQLDTETFHNFLKPIV